MRAGDRPRSRHLSDLCAELAEAFPTRLAIIDGDTELTYGQLDELVTRMAGGLQTLGVGRGSVVGVLCTNRLEWITTAIGAMRVGAQVAAFNTFVKAWDLGHMLRHSAAEVLVTLDRFRSVDYLAILDQLGVGDNGGGGEAMPHLRELVVIGEPGPTSLGFSELLGRGERPQAASTSAADIAFVLYTSGSSARPKAVPLQHYALIENGFEIGERIGLTTSDRVWVSVPLFWAYGACNALMAHFTHGATVVLQDAFEAGRALDLIERHGCTTGYLLPNVARSLLDADGYAPARTASLQKGVTLGSPDDLTMIAEQLGVTQICNIYGQSETYGNCCVTPSSWPLARRRMTQGPPLPRVQLEIRDEQGAVVEAAEVGEIHVRGYVMPGYLDAEEAPDPVGDDGFFATGDLGFLDADGDLHFVGRDSEVIKTAGINVSPLEVEQFLATNPEVREAAVVGVEDARAAQVVVAFVVGRPGLTATGLRDWCAERLAAYKVPARIHLVSELDRTETGKLSRRKLADRDKALSPDRA